MQNHIKTRKHFSVHQHKNFRKFRHETSAMKLVFSKVAASNFVKNGLNHRCFFSKSLLQMKK